MADMTITCSPITALPVSQALEYLLRAASQGNSASRARARSSSSEDSSSDDTDAPRPSRRRRSGELQSLFSEAVDPAMGPLHSLSQVLSWVDKMTGSGVTKVPVEVCYRGWRVKEEKDALHLSVDMPGLGKEHVRLSVEQNTLVLKGEGDKESGDEESRRSYNRHYELPMGKYLVDQIRAEMKNGVLKVVLPKVKEEDRKDVFQIAIE